jgi:tripartite-type tricarboxylate transporter receptor subunit TctC
MNRRRFSVTLAAGAAALPASPSAQSWPDRPVRLIVPFPPGGGTDVIWRQLAERIGGKRRLHHRGDAASD